MKIKSTLLSAVVALGLTAAAVAQSPPTILGDPPPLPGAPDRAPAGIPRSDSRLGPLKPLETLPRTYQGPALGQGRSHGAHDQSGHDHSGHDHSGHSHAPARSYSDQAPSLPPSAPDALPQYGFAEPQYDAPHSHEHDRCPFGWHAGSRSVCPLGRGRLNRHAARAGSHINDVYRHTQAPHYHYLPVHAH